MRDYIYIRLVFIVISTLILLSDSQANSIEIHTFGKIAVTDEDSSQSAKNNHSLAEPSRSPGPIDTLAEIYPEAIFTPIANAIGKPEQSNISENMSYFEFASDPAGARKSDRDSLITNRGLKISVNSKFRRQKDIAKSSKYADVFNAFTYNTGYHTFKISADYLTPTVHNLCLSTSFVPAFWIEKGKKNPLKCDRDLSLSYKFQIDYIAAPLSFKSGFSGIVFTDNSNLIGHDWNYMNYNLDAGVRIIEYTYFKLVMRYPLTSELEKITEPNYTVLIIKEL